MTSKSFRDPSGFVYIKDTHVIRKLHKEAALQDFIQWQKSSVIKKWILEKKLIDFTFLKEEKNHIILHHPKIDFVSYPYEWSYSQLYDAGLLTINLAQDLSKEGLGLKDAHAFNILFKNSNPIFIDLSSIEKRSPHESIWRAYGQFIRMFILPLYLMRNAHIAPSQIFIPFSDGIDYKACIHLTKIYSPFAFFTIYLPYLFSKSSSKKIYKPKVHNNLELCAYILHKILGKAKKQLNKLRPKINKVSFWSSYPKNLSHYTENSFHKKSQWIDRILETKGIKNVLDIGCNTGYFSKMAAKKGASVVAIDSDSTCIDKLYNEAKIHNLSLCPLHVNIARPTPAIGWMNQEYSSFLDRYEDKFSLVMMLAVLHHLILTEKIPLGEIGKLCGKLTNSYLLIEYVAPNDPMFMRLTKGNESLYVHNTFTYFLSVMTQFFSIEKTLENYHPTRRLVFFKK